MVGLFRGGRVLDGGWWWWLIGGGVMLMCVCVCMRGWVIRGVCVRG